MLRVVARATRRITRLDAAAVADEVVMAVRDLGFTIAVVAAVQDGGPRTVGAGGVDVTAADALLADRVPPAVLRGERDGAELDGGGIAVGVATRPPA